MTKANPNTAGGKVDLKDSRDDQRSGRKSLLTPSVSFLLVASYVAFFLSGFGTFLDGIQPYSWRAFPLYIYCAALLLILQRQIIDNANQARLAQHVDPILPIRQVFIIVASLIPLLYAGWARFFGGPSNPLIFPLTYVLLDTIALAGFAYDISTFRPHEDQDGFFGRDTPDPASSQQTTAREGMKVDLGPRVAYLLAWASEAASLAVFCILVGAILAVLATGVTLPFGFAIPRYVDVDLRWLHVFNITALQDVNLALGFFASFVALFLFGASAVLIANNVEMYMFFKSLWFAFVRSFKHAIRSFRVAVSPLIWVIPAFAIAIFAQHVTTFFREASATPLPHGIGDLFSPFNPGNWSNLGEGSLDIGLAILAIGCVLLAFLLGEPDGEVVKEALRRIAAAGRILVALVPLFLLSLMVFNAGLYVTFGAPIPFQLLTATITAAALAAVYASVFLALSRRRVTKRA